MNHSVQRQDFNTQYPGSILASLQFFNGILNWLAGFVQLTEEEQDEAGIYLGHSGRE